VAGVQSAPAHDLHSVIIEFTFHAGEEIAVAKLIQRSSLAPRDLRASLIHPSTAFQAKRGTNLPVVLVYAFTAATVGYKSPFQQQ
jgi:hypothetical protein